jgi:hypothetical protein
MEKAKHISIHHQYPCCQPFFYLVQKKMTCKSHVNKYQVDLVVHIKCIVSHILENSIKRKKICKIAVNTFCGFWG